MALAGDSDLLTGEPQHGDAVLLSLRSRSFYYQTGFKTKVVSSIIPFLDVV